MGTIASRVVRALQEAGVRTLFGVPGGGSNLDLIQAARDHGLPFVLTSTETGAAIAALAQAEVTGSPGACLATLGPGAASIVNGVACASLDRAPLFVFTDSHPSAAEDRFPHQRLDQRALFSPITRWSGLLSIDHVDGVLDYAWRAVLGPPPGPVHIECPSDFETASYPAAVLTAPPSAPIPATAIGALQARISQARKPLVIAGLGARRTEDAHAIRRLCERRQIPAMVTYKAKGVVPDDHPRFAGVFTHGAIERSLVAESDLIVAVGLDPVELLPRPWNYAQPAVYVGPWRVEDRQVPYVSQQIGPIAATLEHLEDSVRWSDWDLDAVRLAAAQSRHLIDIAGEGLTAPQAIDVLARQAPANARVTVDAGAHMFPATMLWPIAEPNQMLISNGLSTMGFAVPAAIGAALLDRDRPVVAVTGDGGLLMCAGELLAIARERLPIAVVVFDDRSLSLIDIKQRQRGLDSAGVGLGAVDWTALATSLGLAAFSAHDATQLEEAIDRALAAAAPALIAVRIDPSVYASTLKVVRG